MLIQTARLRTPRVARLVLLRKAIFLR